jgi:hypothetical protein
MSLRALGLVASLLALATGRAAAQVDSTLRRATILRQASPALVRELTRYAAPVDTPPRARPPLRVLIARPAWAKDSLLAARWVRREEAPQQPAPALRLAFRQVRAINPVAMTPAADSALRGQASPDWRMRAAEVTRINRLPARQIHPQVAAALITQLDSVGVNRMNRLSALPAEAQAGDREDYGEYVLTLSRAVLRLNDVRAVRAVAMAGLGTSRESQRFVAAQGAASLPILDTAFALSADASGAVVTTWAYMLAASPAKLGSADSVFVYGRIQVARWSHTIPFLYAARIAQLFELKPIVDSLTRDSSAAVAGAAQLASRDLAQKAAAAPASAWATRLRLYAGFVCAGTLDTPRAACPDLLAAANAVADAVRTPAGRPRLAALLLRVAADAGQLATAQGITAADQRMLQLIAQGVGGAR